MLESLKEFVSYQRPERVRPSSLKSESSDLSTSSSASTFGIPDKLSFARVLNGETCFPCRLDDFMNYLTYVERNPENLRFYLWFRKYIQKFDNLSNEEKALSPVWECPLLKERTKFENIITASEEHPSDLSRQPFRAEIDHIAQTFLLQSSLLELNLSGRDRQEALRALAVTTHPSAFKSVLPHVETSLRQQSHPNFIRFSLSTSNDGRIVAMRWGGLIMILSGIVLAVALSLGRVHKAIRIVFPCILIFFGICSMLDGQRSVCLVLLTFGVRDRFAWEKDTDCLIDAVEGDIEKSSATSFNSANNFDRPIPRDEDREEKIKKFERRGIVSHVLLGWTKLKGIDPEVARIQKLMVLQNAAIASLFTCITVAILGGIPGGNMY